MEVLVRDLRYAVRSARRSPALTAAVLLVIALGIGTATAVFSVINGMLLSDLPYPGSERLVRVWEEHPGGSSPAGNRWLSHRTQSAWITDPRTVERIGAYAVNERTVAFDPDDPVRMTGADVSPSIFRMLGVTPVQGRFFHDGEDREGAPRVIVLGEQLWRERYGAAADVVGRTLVVEGNSHTIVGVAPGTLTFPDRRARFWIPNVVPRWAEESSRTRVFSAIARLRGDATPRQAEAEGTAAARAVPRPPSANVMFGTGGLPIVRVTPLAADTIAPVRPALLVLGAAALLLLLVACANVANLLLSRGLARERELVIRLAAGASRGRLGRQLLTESLALAAAGGALGVALAWALVRMLPSMAPARLPRLEHVDFDVVVVVFSVVASVVVAAAAGLAPAVRAGRMELSRSIAIMDRSPASVVGVRGMMVRRALLVLQTALAVTLVVATGLLARSFIRLLDVDAGYTADRVVAVRVQMPPDAPPERSTQFLDAVLPRLRGLQGVTSAGAGSMMPLTRMTAITTITLPEQVAGGLPPTVRALTYTVTPGYAEALALRLKEGRVFDSRDISASTQGVIVNEEFVRRHISHRPVTGIALGPLYSEETISTEIIGVVANVLKDGNDRQPEPEMYFAQGAGARRIVGYVNLVIRTAGDPADLLNDVRTLVRDVDRRATIETLAPLTTLLDASVEEPRFSLTIMAGFAVLAVALAAVGLYGALSYTVGQRRRELGVRAALGADRRQLLSLVFVEAMTVAATGAVVGIVAAALLTRFMRALLFGIPPLDALSFAGAAIMLLLVSSMAALIPAWRAAATDPAAALRDC